jgi:hypothetical protein
LNKPAGLQSCKSISAASSGANLFQLPPGSSLWALVEDALGSTLSNDQFKQAVKQVAEFNAVMIPEWGLNNGQRDARELLAGSIINLSPLRELFK